MSNIWFRYLGYAIGLSIGAAVAGASSREVIGFIAVIFICAAMERLIWKVQ